MIESSQAPADLPEPVHTQIQPNFSTLEAAVVEEASFLLKKAKHTNNGILTCRLIVFICRISNS